MWKVAKSVSWDCRKKVGENEKEKCEANPTIKNKKKIIFQLDSIKSAIKKRPTSNVKKWEHESTRTYAHSQRVCVCVCHRNIIIFETDFNSLLREAPLFSPFYILLCFTVISPFFFSSFMAGYFSSCFFSFIFFVVSFFFLAFLSTLCEFIVGTACRRLIKFSPRIYSEQNGLLNILTIQAVIVICEMIRMGCLFMFVFVWLNLCVRACVRQNYM